MKFLINLVLLTCLTLPDPNNSIDRLNEKLYHMHTLVKQVGSFSRDKDAFLSYIYRQGAEQIVILCEYLRPINIFLNFFKMYFTDENGMLMICKNLIAQTIPMSQKMKELKTKNPNGEIEILFVQSIRNFIDVFEKIIKMKMHISTFNQNQCYSRLKEYFFVQAELKTFILECANSIKEDSDPQIVLNKRIECSVCVERINFYLESMEISKDTSEEPPVEHDLKREFESLKYQITCISSYINEFSLDFFSRLITEKKYSFDDICRQMPEEYVDVIDNRVDINELNPTELKLFKIDVRIIGKEIIAFFNFLQCMKVESNELIAAKNHVTELVCDAFKKLKDI